MVVESWPPLPSPEASSESTSTTTAAAMDYARSKRPRSRSRSPPPRSYGNGAGLPKPESFAHLVTFSYFRDYLKGLHGSSISRDSIARDYESYRARHRRFLLQDVYEDHKAEPWFVERYKQQPGVDEADYWPGGPINRDEKGRMDADRLARLDKWKAEWEAGTLEVSFDQLPPSDGPVAEGSAATAGKEDTKPLPSTDNCLVISDISVLTTRAELTDVVKDALNWTKEEAVKVAQAAAEKAASKKAAAAAAVAEAAKETKEEEDDKPVEAEGGPKDEEMAEAPAGDAAEAVKDGAPEDKVKDEEDTEMIIPEDEEEINLFDHLSVTDPNPQRKYLRTAYVRLNTSSPAKVAWAAAKLNELDPLPLSGYQISCIVAPIIGTAPVRRCPGISSAKSRISKDLDQVKTLVKFLEAKLPKSASKKGEEATEATVGGGRSIESRWREKVEELKEMRGDMSDEEFHTAEEANNKTALDQYLSYLRSVFLTCYYCSFVALFPDEFHRRCIAHEREPVSPEAQAGKPRPSEAEWAQAVDDKAALLVGKEGMNPTEYDGLDPDSEIHSICAPHTKQEDDSKFRCLTCNKLFSAQKFVEKHLQTKHSELVLPSLEKVKLFNAFMGDPSHIFLPGTKEPDVPAPQSSYGYSGGYNNGGYGGAPMLGNYAMGPPVGYGSPAGGGGGGGWGRGPPLPMRREDDRAIKKMRTGPPPPPPKGAVVDPRAKRGVGSYADLDGAPSGGAADIVLDY